MERRTFLAGAALAGIAPAVPVLAQETAGTQPLVERFAATLSAHDLAAFEALFADDYVNHQVSAAAPAPAAGTTAKQGTVGYFAARLEGIPDLQVSIESAVASADKVAASFVYTGTHQGTYFGVTATGRRLRFTSCDIFLVRNNQFAEHWGMGDIAGVLAQLKS
ncbi:ester cyclase [Telmatospirillum sp.]|uniref:ester cyclase n=1 Tax=Telmatospirillum sp. TaxID=2079197 RepID=UPI002841B2A9|nr:ester cyclase [Telmatospirillum sp.]MDR3435027.1 ester cyclase [Telmatospirillum sp.]